MKNNKKGKAALWTPEIIRKMRANLIAPNQRLIFEISLYTGERMGAITQLRVEDVYDQNSKTLDTITFAPRTRKSTKHGLAATRQVAVHPDLKFYLDNYFPKGNDGYLFPSGETHLTVRAVDIYWRKILNRLGLKGFSTHSSRRWVINQLRSSGIEIVTIAETMGMNINTVRHYLDDDPVECQRAIATLTTV